MLFRNVKMSFNKIILFRRSNLWIRRSETTRAGKPKLEDQWDRVNEVENKIQLLQEERRKVQKELLEIRNSLQDSKNDLSKTSLSDEKYVPMATLVSCLLKEQILLSEMYSHYDKMERLCQAMLSATENRRDNAISDIQKYIIRALIFGLLGVIISDIISSWHVRKEIEHFGNVLEQCVAKVNDFSDSVRPVDEQ